MVPVILDASFSSKTAKENRIEYKESNNPDSIIRTLCSSANEKKELFYFSSSIPFDDQENQAASVDDLSVNLMRKHLLRADRALYDQALQMNTIEIARSLQVVSGPPEYERPVNAGILLFSGNPQKYFPYARIGDVCIPNETGHDLEEKGHDKEEKIFTGPIQYQLQEAIHYVDSLYIIQKVIKHDYKAEADRVWNYPLRAFEVILANAVCCRGYRIHEPITVKITNIEIKIACFTGETTSFSGMDKSISNDAASRMEVRARSNRNRRIGDFLKEIGFIEGRSTGFPKARQTLKHNGSKDLKIDRYPETVFIRSYPGSSCLSS